MRKVVLLSAIYLLLATPVFAQSVDILWQGEGFVPPFYVGRSLWSSQSRINLVAIPQKLGIAANLNYKWSKNGTVLGSLSGVGKNSLSFFDSVISKPQNIKVEIVSSEGDVLAESSTIVNPRKPELLVYEESPLYGFLFHKEVGANYPLKEAEVTFKAFPLFFSASDLAYLWRTNTGETGVESSATYRAPEEGAGSASVSIEVKSEEKILQSGKINFLVQFDNNGN